LCWALEHKNREDSLKGFIKVLPILLLLFTAQVYADANSKYANAKKLYELTKVTNDQAVVDHFVNLIVNSSPELLEKESVIREFIFNFVTSKEYTDGKVQIYVDVYTDAELAAAVKLFSNPIYEKIKLQQAEVMRLGSEHTMNLYMQKIPELQVKLGL